MNKFLIIFIATIIYTLFNFYNIPNVTSGIIIFLQTFVLLSVVEAFYILTNKKTLKVKKQ
jgi:hypothetical protein